LSNELLGNKTVNKNEFGGYLNESSQQLKDTRKRREDRRSKVINNAQETVEKLKQRLNNTVSQIGTSLDPVKKDFKSNVKEIIQKLDILSKNSNLATIDGYIKQLEIIADRLGPALDVLQKQINDGKKPNVSFELLNQLEMYNSVFSFIDDINISVLNDYFEKEFEKEGWSKEDSDEFKNLIFKVKAEYDSIKAKHINVGRVHLSYKLAEFSNREVVLRRLELEKEFKQDNPKQSKESLSDYNKKIRNLVNDQIANELPQLKKDEQLSILEKLTSSPADIAQIGMWVSSEKDLNSNYLMMLTIMKVMMML
jgi:hypothetical protein